MKFDDTPSREEREDFWLDLGPASAYEGWTAVRQPAATATPARTALPMVSKGRKPGRPRGPARRRPGQRTGAASAAQLKRWSGWTRWAVPMMYRPSTDKGREKSYRNKIHLLV